MELSELKLIVKENFYNLFDKSEFKLVLVGKKENIKHLSYMVVSGSEPYIWFSTSPSGVYQATSTEILSSAYNVKQWYYFLKNTQEALYKVWERDNCNG